MIVITELDDNIEVSFNNKSRYKNYNTGSSEFDKTELIINEREIS